MDDLIAWCAFVGAWLLFVGPLYQAVLELDEQDLERDRIAATKAAVDRPVSVSKWWWLVPPVHYVLWRRKSRAYRREVMRTIDPADMQDLIHYMSKAIGWLLVGFGGLLLAVSETWQLRERYDWPIAVFWALAAVMVLASASYASAGRGRAHQMRAAKQAGAGAQPGPG